MKISFRDLEPLHYIHYAFQLNFRQKQTARGFKKGHPLNFKVRPPKQY